MVSFLAGFQSTLSIISVLLLLLYVENGLFATYLFMTGICLSCAICPTHIYSFFIVIFASLTYNRKDDFLEEAFT